MHIRPFQMKIHLLRQHVTHTNQFPMSNLPPQLIEFGPRDTLQILLIIMMSVIARMRETNMSCIAGACADAMGVCSRPVRFVEDF